MSISSPSRSPRDSRGSRSSRSSRNASWRAATRDSYRLINSPTISEADPLHTSNLNPTSNSSINSTAEDPAHAATVVYQPLRRRLSCRRSCYDRTPKGKSVLLVFLLNVIETCAFYSAVDGALGLVLEEQGIPAYSISQALQATVGRLAYPLAGLVADVYLGRYRVIHTGLWVLMAAHCLLAMILSMDHYLTENAVRYVLGVIAYALVSAGSASVEANIIPFGVDQLSQGPTSAEMSSYFYWYYFGRQLGTLVGVLLYLLPTTIHASDSSGSEALTTIPSIVVVLILGTAVLLQMYLKHWFFKDAVRPNPLKLVAKVLWYAATAKRQFPRYRRAFRYGERRKPRIELAKIENDGIYEREVVEDVKTFCQILLVLASFGGYWISYSGAYLMQSYQAGNMFTNVTNIKTTELNIFIFCNVLTIMASLPLLNYLVLPCFPSLTMKKRIGVGMLLNTFSVAVAAILELMIHKKSFETQLLSFLVPTILQSVAEALVSVTTLEFIYAQSPESAKGFLIGMSYFTLGVFSVVGVVMFYFVLNKSPLHYPTTEDVSGVDPVLWYYVALAVIGAMGFVMYSLTACLYTNRQRPNLPEDESYYDSRRNAGEWANLLPEGSSSVLSHTRTRNHFHAPISA